jgi:sterol desaturase/sphingolipid hydroxylase (fatty acid hydroxylase superfamily)
MRADRMWWYVFALAFVATGLAESLLPARVLRSSLTRRWISNSILLIVSSLVGVCAYEFTGIALAFATKASSFGVLNRLPISYALRFAAGFAAFDLSAYVSHRAFHAVSPLWRIHRVHHSETDLDLTTGLRFHPAEALVVRGFSLLVIAVLGIPPAAVVVAGFAILAQDFFTHANVRFPERADRWLRLLIVTAPMHRVHHSECVQEQNTNFATIFSVWDRLFRTYNAGPSLSADPSRCGLVEIANGSDLNAARLLILPFQRPPTNNP